jgi:alpha-L-rhamnosidase
MVIEPRPGGGLTFAKASVETMYGLVAAGWEKTSDKLTVKVEIPANTTATVKLPGGKVEEVGSGQYEFAEKN